ncbi:hypothetical protein GCM10011399_09060 [Subtercola lobariae]|uniref:Uncharacterized protein n=1 Tax=Subtercola lobariae TaxID=1588641 RepID=A0A917B474_9MICO|nr:hypothetical protein GCM10011399_09060 [Subtercola lobariae]
MVWVNLTCTFLGSHRLRNVLYYPHAASAFAVKLAAATIAHSLRYCPRAVEVTVAVAVAVSHGRAVASRTVAVAVANAGPAA